MDFLYVWSLVSFTFPRFRVFFLGMHVLSFFVIRYSFFLRRGEEADRSFSKGASFSYFPVNSAQCSVNSEQ